MIGITPLVDIQRESLWMLPGYMEALEQAGAIPVMIPLVDSSADISAIVDKMDGFLLTGGQDVCPQRYRAQVLPECGEVSHERDALEYRLIRIALRQNKPILGICRGIQMLNVYFGGTLFQDLPTQHASETDHHMEPPYDREVHQVDLVAGSPLHQVLKCDSLGVNSYHHQAIRRLAPRLEVMAVSEDGIIEAVDLPDYRFVWGIQWHPEFSFRTDEASQRIFSAFTAACKEESKGKRADYSSVLYESRMSLK